VHAALTSNAPALEAPRRAWISAEHDGRRWSGVSVPTMMRSSSLGSTLALSSACRAAWRHRSLVACSGVAKRRSRIPVRWTIHSSDVSTSF